MIDNSPQTNSAIVVIEDDDFLSDAYKIKFEQMGIHIFLARDGESGLQLVKKNQPKLIILDLMLPKMDGFEVLTAIKKNEDLKDIPVVIASNFADDDHRKKCQELGAADFFVKSEISIADLIHKCQQYLK